MRLIKYTLIVVLFNISTFLQAQDFTFGGYYAYGEGTYKNISSSDNIIFSPIHQYGLSFAYSPYYSKLSAETVFAYEKSELADYFFIPLGFRITLGKKIKPFVEGGGYYSFLIKDNSEIYKMKNDYGARIGAGLQFAFGRQWRLEIATFKKFGFAGSLVEKKPIPGNNFTEEKSRISPLFLEVSFKYRY